MNTRYKVVVTLAGALTVLAAVFLTHSGWLRTGLVVLGGVLMTPLWMLFVDGRHAQERQPANEILSSKDPFEDLNREADDRQLRDHMASMDEARRHLD